MAVFTALFDANVLYSMPVTDLMLELAATGLFRARWSEAIHAEWMLSVLRDRPDLPRELVERRRRKMDEAVPTALIDGYQDLVPGLMLPDLDDRHVLAAAIAGRCDVIVTFNVNHFPATSLERHGLESRHPDEFLNHQRSLNEPLFLSCVKRIRERLSKPKYSAEAYIDNLRANGLQAVAAELSKAKGLI